MGDFYGTGIEIWAGFGPNGPMKLSYTSNEMRYFAAHLMNSKNI